MNSWQAEGSRDSLHWVVVSSQYNAMKRTLVGLELENVHGLNMLNKQVRNLCVYSRPGDRVWLPIDQYQVCMN